MKKDGGLGTVLKIKWRKSWRQREYACFYLGLLPCPSGSPLLDCIPFHVTIHRVLNREASAFPHIRVDFRYISDILRLLAVDYRDKLTLNTPLSLRLRDNLRTYEPDYCHV